MPRKPRLEVPGYIYHVIARGIERRNIFSNDTDYNFFLNRLGEILTDTKTSCLAFCLIPNHFHLLLRSGKIPTSTVMRRLLTGYALFFNKRHRRSGYLFQNRYKSIICQENPYLLELIRYIHLNPIRARTLNTLSQLNTYPFAGHSALLERKKYHWYPSETVLKYFGKNKKKAKEKYLEFITDGLSMGRNPKYTGGGLRRSLGDPKRYSKEKQAFDDRILGSGDFVLTLQELEKKEKEKDIKVSVEDLIKKAAKTYSLEPEQIQGRGKTKKLKEARTLVAYLAVIHLGFSFAEAARHLKIHRSTVARMVERGKGVMKDIDFKPWIRGKKT